jgi:transcriptional regulator of arginine metabolism
MRSHRRRDLLQILHEGTAASQHDIAIALQERGHDVTQATVSRDLQEVGATKVRVNGGYTYRLPEEIPRVLGGDLMTRRLEQTLAQFVIDVQPAASIVVLYTAPGHAPAVARAIDQASFKGVVGTIAGDDTIFVAATTKSEAERIARLWQTTIAAEAMR